MRKQTAAGLAVAALSLLLVAARPHMRHEDWMDGIDMPMPFLLIGGVSPRNLAANIEGFAKGLEGAIAYARKRRGLGLSDEEVARRLEKSYRLDHGIFIHYAGWLADAVERMPEAADWKDDAVYKPLDSRVDAWSKRLPRADDFHLWEEELDSESFQHKKLEAGDAEFKPR